MLKPHVHQNRTEHNEFKNVTLKEPEKMLFSFGRRSADNLDTFTTVPGIPG